MGCVFRPKDRRTWWITYSAAAVSFSKALTQRAGKTPIGCARAISRAACRSPLRSAG